MAHHHDDHHHHDHGCGCGHHHEEEHSCGCGHHHEEEHSCGCGHHHEEEHSCGCGHHHEEEHSCGCGHHHEEEHACSCGHDHHHDHDGCGCGHDHHHDHDGCGCGHDHHHDHDGCGCSCGHDHHHDHDGCGCSCGHDHHHDHDGCGCGCGHEHITPHTHEGAILLTGAGLFAAGLLAKLLPFGWVSTVLHLAAYILLGLPILTLAGKNILRGHIFDENFLMSIATIGALFIGEIPEAVGVMLFYRLGEYFEQKATAGSRKSIMEAVDMRPETVTLTDGTVIPAAKAKVGMHLQIRPGDRIPLDGRILSGESFLDTAPLTGEPVPVKVAPGSSVLSGCINGQGLLTLEVEKPLGDSMVTRILRSVEQAAASKPKMDRFITRFSRVYTPIVVALAAATALIPSLITGDWNYWVYTALSFLVMSCPCALVISVPLAFFSGIGVGSRKGILFKGGAAMEVLADVKAAALDKTGTLTEGRFAVLRVEGEKTLLYAAACEGHSSHPIAAAILAAAEGEVPACTDTKEVAGMGIEAVVEGKQVLCGNEKLMNLHGIRVEPLSGTAVFVAVDGSLLGHILLGDKLKEETPDAISALKKQGIHPVMLTGDAPVAAEAVAKEAGIHEIHAGLLPTDKLEQMEALRRQHGKVLFVGDGINDAPVLAGADVGAAMGSGADAAIESADVVFMTDRADAIPEAVDLSRRTRRIAWQNVYFAIGIKALVMILGLLGFANMWLAVFADSGVAMLCVLNSIRLLRKK